MVFIYCNVEINEGISINMHSEFSLKVQFISINKNYDTVLQNQ